MNVIVDADVVNWYSMELRELVAPATGPVSPCFDRLGTADVAYIDSGGQIEQEWRATVDTEWFEQWYPTMLITGAITPIPASVASALLRYLRLNHGFPRSRDAWYVSTAKAVRDAFGEDPVILTEDLDFYNPADKGCNAARRNRILTDCSGPVARHLRRSEGILVRSVAVHCP